MANQVWTDVSGDWDNATLWGPSPGVPAIHDTATLGGTVSYQVTIGGSTAISEDIAGLILSDTSAALDIGSGSTLSLSDALTNNGTIFVAAGATLELAAGAFVEPGRISFAPGAELMINAGTGATTGQVAALLNSVTGDGATVVVTGTINNAGATLNPVSMPFLGVTFDLHADLVGGTLDLTGGTLSGSPTLDGVRVLGPILLGTTGQNLTVVDAVAAQPLGAGVTFDGRGAGLSFGDAEVLNSVTIAVGSAAAGVDSIFGDFIDPLTLGPNALISVAAHDTAIAGPPSELLIDGFSTFYNEGTISVGQNGPAFFDLFAVAQLLNTGTLAIGPGATLIASSDTIVDTGPILIGAGGYFGIGSTLTTAQLTNLFGHISGGAGIIGFDGVLDNAGSVLSLATVPGSVSIGGLITGGTIVAPADKTPVDVGFAGSLTDLTYQGVLSLPDSNTDLTLANVTFAGPGGVGSGTIQAASSADVLIVTHGSLDHLVLQSGSSALRLVGGASLTLGPGFLWNSPGEADVVADTLLNAGTLAALAAGSALILVGDTVVNSGTITVGPGGTLSVGQAGGTKPLSIANTGVIGVGAGGTLVVGDVETTAQLLNILGTLVTPGSITVDLAGTLINTGATLEIGGSAVISTLLLTGSIIGGSTTGTIVNQGGTIVSVYESVSTAPCFCAGTRILTEDGPRPVETLRVGDRVRTWAGALVPIIWIGQREVDLVRHPHPDRVRPVCISAGAFAPMVPQRDLLVSPDHAIFVPDGSGAGGVLIPARYLVNAATIREATGSTRAHYFHVELPAHDVLLAEGLPTESYLDTGNRDQFAQGTVRALHPEFTPRYWKDACAPLCLSGPDLTRARNTLLERAAVLGYQQHPVRLALCVGARPVRPVAIRGGVHSYMLPAGVGSVRLVSPVFVPAHMQIDAQDRRALGVSTGGVLINGRALALDDAAFGVGFYPVETDRRWTDGDAHLRLPAQHIHAPMLLQLFINGFATVWESAGLNKRIGGQ